MRERECVKDQVRERESDEATGKVRKVEEDRMRESIKDQVREREREREREKKKRERERMSL